MFHIHLHIEGSEIFRAVAECTLNQGFHLNLCLFVLFMCVGVCLCLCLCVVVVAKKNEQGHWHIYTDKTLIKIFCLHW